MKSVILSKAVAVFGILVPVATLLGPLYPIMNDLSNRVSVLESTPPISRQLDALTADITRELADMEWRVNEMASIRLNSKLKVIEDLSQRLELIENRRYKPMPVGSVTMGHD